MPTFLATARRIAALLPITAPRDPDRRRWLYRDRLWTSIEQLEDRTLLSGAQPVAPDATVSTPRNEPVTIYLDDFASDAETPDSQLTYTFNLNTVRGGTIEYDAENHAVVFTPDPNFTGPNAGFQYTVTDTATGNGRGNNAAHSKSGTISIDLLHDRATTTEDTPLNLDIRNNNANPNQPTNVTSVTDGANGTVTKVDGDTVRYTPNENFHGEDSFTYTVTNSVTGKKTTVTVLVTVTPVNDAPTLGTNTGLTLDEGGTATIEGSMLKANDIEQSASQLTYTIDDAPNHGTLYRNGPDGPQALGKNSTFTQADIDAGRIGYVHNGGESTGDSFKFTVRDGQGGSKSGTFQITVNPVNDDPTIERNREMVVDEGDTGAVNMGRLLTTDPEQSATGLTYTVTSGPANGELSMTTFTQDDINKGRVTYTHNGSETTADSFDFTVSDGQGGTVSGTFSIRVSPVNDPPVIDVNDGLTVLEGGEAAITGAELSTSDAEQSPEELVYTLFEGPTNGTLYYTPDGCETQVLCVGATFTQADLDAGRIKYVHNGGETTEDSFRFSVTDGTCEAVTDTFHIIVTPVNDLPVVVVNTGATVGEGNAVVLDGSALRTTDDDQPDATQIVYTITSAPEHGTIEMLDEGGWRALGAGDTFTQADLDAGRVRYVSNPSTSTTDSFRFDVQDSQGACVSDSFAIAITHDHLDFGDAPNTYGTTIGGDGARHQVTGSGPVLGSSVVAGQPGDPLDGTSDADENGVHFITALQTSSTVDGTTIIEVTIDNPAVEEGETARLSAWIDFNGDGDFDDPGEQVLVEHEVHDGVNYLTITVPQGLDVPEGGLQTYARFRLHTGDEPLGPTGYAADGEVEDYAVVITNAGSLEFLPPSELLAGTVKTFMTLPALNPVEPGTKEVTVVSTKIEEGSEEDAINQAMIELANYYAATYPGETIVIIVLDPVDFVVTDPSGRQAGHTADTGTVNSYSSASYSGDGAVEVLVIRNATPGQYDLALTGVGSEFRGGTAVVHADGSVQTNVITGGLGAGDTVTVSLDFSTPTVAGGFSLIGQVAAAEGAAGNGQVLFSVNDETGDKDPAGDELAMQKRLDAQSESGRPGAAAAEIRRWFTLSSTSLRAVRKATVAEATPDWFGEETEQIEEMLEQFWTGLGQSMLGGIPGRLYNLAEFLGNDLPMLFDPGPAPSTNGEPQPASDTEAAVETEGSAGQVAVLQAAPAAGAQAELVAVAEERE